MTMNRQNEDKKAVDALCHQLEQLESAESEEKTQSDHSELRREIEEKKSALMEVCPLIPVEEMAPSFIKWLKSFNERNAKRQIRHLERIKKYLEDRSLRIDDQISIRKKAVDYWFTDSEGQRT